MTDSPYRTPEQESMGADGSLDLAGSVRGMQIITGAMLMSVVTFSVVVLAIGGGDLSTDLELESLFGVGFAGFAFIGHIFVPPIIQRVRLSQISAQQLENTDDEARARLLLPSLRGSHIVACALLEGAVFLNLVMYMITSSLWNLVAAGLLVVSLVARFPTQSRVRAWIRHTSENIQLR